MPETERLSADPDGIARAAALLAAGELVAFPTETVYGLGADARNGQAVARVFEAKGRPRFNPLIVHLPDLSAAQDIAEIAGDLERLAATFWPGPLTLVAPLRPGAGLSDLVTAGLATVAIRVPAHPVAQRLLAVFGGSLAGPSANPSGKVSPTTADHVLEGLGGRIAAVLDAGPCAVGLESSIVGIEGGVPVLLRPGGLPAEAIEDCLGRPLGRAGVAITAPGQLASHYAPGVRLRLGATAPAAGEGWLGFGPDPEGCCGPCLNLSPSGDMVEAAANLFAHLRAIDAAMGGQGTVAVAAIPERGLGRAINDRLRRAAAPRP
ncbi:L-threonylcarbamoyladenylate synthase [Limibaculum sp. FT325]|uniref:L-threonylcarbamoyladenylate synthase n=1 Tax=Thermohalobaculum sediminis TaxID=2939436 RepID=UPI0020C14D04|nr:L-threonylcarbamoyladenylate synthase [Limibaculum sediminis]MCL5777084.1 L-threonylcarbamoyladenylate synthase [Limibaculum sediminis]